MHCVNRTLTKSHSTIGSGLSTPTLCKVCELSPIIIVGNKYIVLSKHDNFFNATNNEHLPWNSRESDF